MIKKDIPDKLDKNQRKLLAYLGVEVSLKEELPDAVVDIDKYLQGKKVHNPKAHALNYWGVLLQKEFGAEVSVRAGIALSQKFLGRKKKFAAARKVTEAAECWVLKQSAKNLSALDKLASGLIDVLIEEGEDDPDGWPIEITIPGNLTFLAQGDSYCSEYFGTYLEDCYERCHDLPKLVEAIQKELVPWALGKSDPVKKRFAKR